MSKTFMCPKGCLLTVQDEDLWNEWRPCPTHGLKRKLIEWTVYSAEAKQARRVYEMYWEMWKEKNRSIIGWKLGRLRVNVSWRK